MNCPYCYKQIPDGSKFCPECGGTINARTYNTEYTSPAQNSQSSYDPNGYANNNAAQNGYYQNNYYNQNNGYYYDEATGQYYTYNAETGQYYYVTQEEPKKKGGLAIASFILSLCSSFTCGISALLGLIFGLCSLKSNKKGFAIAGTIISAVFLVIFIASFIFGFYSGYTGAYDGFVEGFEEFYHDFY